MEPQCCDYVEIYGYHENDNADPIAVYMEDFQSWPSVDTGDMPEMNVHFVSDGSVSFKGFAMTLGRKLNVP